MIEKERKILLVDDEPNILRSLKRLFRRDSYQVLTANSGREGLELLNSQSVGVILSDQRMPEMNGTEFLKQAKSICPDSVRIVLSGYTDLESITDAINNGAIYKFLTKPWDDELLRQNIKEAFEVYELKEENVRLSESLKAANEELTETNKKLLKATKEKERLIQLQTQALQMTQAVFNRVPIGLISVDHQRSILVYNEAALNGLASEHKGMIGFSIDDALPPELVNNIDNFKEDIVFPITLKGGKYDCHLSAVRDASSCQGYFIALMPVS